MDDLSRRNFLYTSLGTAAGAHQRARTNKANSVLLHELYFDGMTAKSSNPGGEIKAAIEKRFGSLEQWAIDFIASAKAASGWAVLAIHQLNGKVVYIEKFMQHINWESTDRRFIGCDSR